MRSFRAVREKESVRAVTGLYAPDQTRVVIHLNGISNVQSSALSRNVKSLGPSEFRYYDLLVPVAFDLGGTICSNQI